MSSNNLNHCSFARRGILVACVALLVLASATSTTSIRTAKAAATVSTLSVVGNQLIDNGNVVILRGVNRSGSEYACWQNFGFFDGPSDDASVAAIASWGLNAVRVPLNEDCWLGINGVPAQYSGANYQAAITGFVTRLRNHGLYVLLSSQTAGPGTVKSTTILPMPDLDHTPTFWTQVANTFKGDKGVIFDLYNEPHDVSWSCWANGCLVTGGVNWTQNYQAAGMNTLTAAIRATGATNVLNVPGLSWSYDIGGWLANHPNDSQIIAGIHNYGASGWDTPAIWNVKYAPTALQYPVIFGEMGFDVYVETVMPWADAHGIGYLAWTWDTWGNREALISNYNGTPTTYGLGFKNYIAGLATQKPTVGAVVPNSGPAGGGTSVTITGTNFTGATAVKFGATAAATFAVNNATTITATSPAGSGTVDVTVTTPGGSSAISLADRFTFGTPTAPTSLRVVDGDTEATLTWTLPLSGSPITGYTVTASPGGAITTVSAVVPAATVTGLTNGTPYTFTVAATNAIGTGPASLASAAVTPTAVAQGASVAVLPAMSNGAYGGYLTAAYLENVSASAAHIRVQYFDQTGVAVGSGNSVAGLVAGGTWTLRTDNGHSLAALQAGSAIVYSDQPLAVFVNEFALNGSDATSYTAINVPSGTGSTLFAPAIANNAYGGYTTGIGLVNVGSTATNLTITYRDGSGATVKTQTLNNVAAGAYQALYSGDTVLALPAGFAGTATITSSAGNLAAVVNETGPGGQFSSYDAVPAGSTTLYAPAALNNAYGGYNTGMGIQNTTGTAGTVTINYYDTSGTATTNSFPIAANGYLGVYQGTDIPVAGAYTASLTSTVAIAAIVTEVAPSITGAKQSTAYNTFAAGSSSLHLPLVESVGPDGWSTAQGIMNTGTAATMVTVTYYDTVTGAQLGTPQSLSLQPNAFWGLYQPTGGLPIGSRASAVVTAAAGGQVAVICNESNLTSFMSYTGT